MDMTTITTTANATVARPSKSPEAESETPPRIQLTKPNSFTNGVFKRHHHAPPSNSGAVNFKECLRNHAASKGGHALDGCGEFMPAPTATPSDPTSLKCAACGCHRNFHRRDPEDAAPAVSPVIEYHPHHRHRPPPPPPPPQVVAAAEAAAAAARSPGSQSPPPISSTYYPGSAPHMLLALSGGAAEANNINNLNHHHHHHHHHHNQQHHNLMDSSISPNPSRKRFRTKFTQDQKEKMHDFADKVGWKLHKSNEDMVNGFCRDIGVERGVFKVWMHNNKNTLGKRSANSEPNGVSNQVGIIVDGNSHSSGSHNQQEDQHQHLHHRQLFGSNESNAPTNGSSSSS